MSLPVPPLIPPSMTYNAEEISLFKGDYILSDKITDGVSTLEDGIISNLIDPVEDSDISTKNYLINKQVKPSDPNLSVQYNNAGEFKGSSTFTFDGNTMTIDEITNGTVSFSEGTFTGLSNPTGSSQAATKKYVDNTSYLYESEVSLNSSFTYSSEQMVNGIIYRDPISTSLINTKFDTTASAVSIIAQFKNNGIGNSALFFLKNISSNEDSYIYLKPGTGVVFNSGSSSGVTIPKNYIMKSRIVITGSSTVMIFIESISYAESLSGIVFKNVDKNVSFGNDITPYVPRTLLIDSLKISNALYNTYYDDQELVYSGDVSIPWSAIFYGQTTRSSLSQDTSIYFPNPSSLYIFLSGYSGMQRFIFRNGDPNYNITLYGSSGWDLDSNANFTVGPGISATMWLYINGSNGTVSVYMIGKQLFKN